MDKLSNFKIQWKVFVIIAVLAGAGAVVFQGAPVKNVQAANTISLAGYVWSSTIGWISFSSTNAGAGGGNYGIKEDLTNGQLSGHAWSSNMGWISFNKSDLTGCPSGLCVAKVTSGKVTGWARALAAKTAGANAGGWSGWIHLNPIKGPGITQGIAPNYAWDGFMWGSNVVGWINSNGKNNSKGTNCVHLVGGLCTNAPAPTAQITVNVPTITWKCNGNGSAITSVNLTKNGKIVAVSNKKTGTVSTKVGDSFTLICTNAGGSNSKTVVVAPPAVTAATLRVVPNMVPRGKKIKVKFTWSARTNGAYDFAKNGCSIKNTSQKNPKGGAKKGISMFKNSDAKNSKIKSAVLSAAGTLKNTVASSITLNHQTVYNISCNNGPVSGTTAVVNLIPQYGSF